MSKKNKEKKKSKVRDHPYNITLYSDSYSEYIKAEIISQHADSTLISYRRKGSGHKDIELIPNDEIIGIIKNVGKEASTKLFRKESRVEISKRMKLSGLIKPNDAGLVEVTSESGDVSLINPKHAKFIREDYEANEGIPKRGRKSSAEKSSEDKKAKTTKKEKTPKAKVNRKISKKKITTSDSW